jgi:hypothetical protein
MQLPSARVQRPNLSHSTLQSASEAATHLSSLAVQRPSVSQRLLFLQSASDAGTHLLSLPRHRPSSPQTSSRLRQSMVLRVWQVLSLAQARPLSQSSLARQAAPSRAPTFGGGVLGSGEVPLLGGGLSQPLATPSATAAKSRTLVSFPWLMPALSMTFGQNATLGQGSPARFRAPAKKSAIFARGGTLGGPDPGATVPPPLVSRGL